MDQISKYEKTPLNISFPFWAWEDDIVAFPPHWHHCFEILLVTKGGVHVSVSDMVYSADEGDIIMVNSGLIHSYFDSKPKTAVLGLQFYITFFDESFINVRNIIFRNPVISKKNIDDTLYADILRLLQEASAEYHKKAVGYQLAVKSKIYELMLIILREDIGDCAQPAASTRSKRISDFIIKNFNNPDLSLEEAANSLSLNKFYFAHFFKKHMGYSFHSYLTETRVNFAKRYLAETQMSITDVAFRSGFNSLQTFNRVFKATTGFTPSKYRRESASANIDSCPVRRI